ncbi:hypothetical protein [Mangrovivirga cuniculi]|uniref:Uncharacterized protein n=1 Tax=Mangrovivirga cuniculi TaxID=2715131 RepID=A0A4D7JQG9_9BACT|nr:hypothetical protein [Mangrovivirga cuniculi]QCK15730.1 hypothetical protein DCC35_13745 [Mangrovivirga cuniculi]
MYIVQLIILLFFLDPDTENLGGNELVRNENHVITYECFEDRIEFVIDVIGDRTDNTNGKWPNLDYFYLWVDFNNNGKLDSLIDRNFGPKFYNNKLQVCKSLLYSKTRQTTCFFNSNSTCHRQFKKTQNLEIDHVVFEISIPKKELSKSNSYNVYFMIADKYSKTYYPINNIKFEATFKIECNNISTEQMLK